MPISSNLLLASRLLRRSFREQSGKWHFRYCQLSEISMLATLFREFVKWNTQKHFKVNLYLLCLLRNCGMRVPYPKRFRFRMFIPRLACSTEIHSSRLPFAPIAISLPTSNSLSGKPICSYYQINQLILWLRLINLALFIPHNFWPWLGKYDEYGLIFQSLFLQGRLPMAFHQNEWSRLIFWFIFWALNCSHFNLAELESEKIGVYQSPVDFRAHCRSLPHTPAHSRTLPLTPAHTRTLPHMPMHEYIWENDKSQLGYFMETYRATAYMDIDPVDDHLL